jgi:hypothetical protein
LNEEEAAAFLKRLQEILRETGMDWLVASNHLDQESDDVTRALSAKDQLRDLTEDLYSVIVEAPKLLALTMDTLKAKSLAFSFDAEIHFVEGRGDDLIVIKDDAIGALREAADRAVGTLAELRSRLEQIR